MELNIRRHKPFLIGAWVNAITLLLIVCVNIISIWYFRKEGIKGSYLSPWIIIWSIILLAEVIVYIKIRRLIYRKLWVWIHVLLINIALFIIPMSAGFLGTLVYDESENVRTTALWLFKNLIYFIFAFLILGHLFFALTLFKSFQLKKSAGKNDEAPGLLDEFVN
ncbi:hypothetical protein ACFS6H_07765 [Terrimonas rubra]|uniref:Uncharacterized protein n=1 Tax=Terrimonas rubra TaxID=1035890 RepID=A0ABW6A5P9_9BACT